MTLSKVRGDQACILLHRKFAFGIVTDKEFKWRRRRTIQPEREERHLSQVGMSKTKFPIWKADDDDDGDGGAAAHSLTLSLSLPDR